MSAIINVTNLSKSYGALLAVDNISFKVQKGDFFAFLGPNGAGKSTTINILSTLLPYTEGNIEIAGYKLGKDDESIRKQIGIVFQDSLLDPLLTVKENLEVRGAIYGVFGSDLKYKINELMEKIGLEEFINRPYGKLSGGQKRRVDVARALINSPSILFLDEPTTGLDPQTRAKVWEIIKNLKTDSNTTVFFSTHYMEETNIADGVAIIDHGHIIAQGSPEELRMRYSNDLLKIIPKDTNSLLIALNERKLNYSVQKEVVNITVKNSLEALEILKSIENEIISFEVIRGNMDEVFLNLTGHELREGGGV